MMPLTQEGKAVPEYAVNEENQTIALMQCNAFGREYFDILVILPNLDIQHVATEALSGDFIPTLGNWVDSRSFLVDDIHEAYSSVALYDIVSKRKTVLLRESFNHKNLSFRIIDQIDSEFLFSYSSINDINNRFQCGIGYYNVKSPSSLKTYIKEADFETKINFEVKDFEREGRKYNGIYVKGRDDKDNKTLIVYPHGGPHMVVTTTFSKNVYAFANLGFDLLLVNFTGSL